MHKAGGTGPACLLLHGFGSDRLSWTGTIPALTAANTVYVLDLPGHGDSEWDVGDGSPRALSEHVETAIDAQGLRVYLVGHSLGGGVGLILAQRRPDLVASLVLSAPAGIGQGVDVEFLQSYPQLDDVATATAALRRLVVRPHLIGRQIVQRALDQLARPGSRDAVSRIAAGLISGAAALNSAAADVGRSAIPRMVIWGQEDRINPPSSARLEEFGGEGHLISDTGHLPHIENAKVTNSLLAAFLSKNVAA